MATAAELAEVNALLKEGKPQLAADLLETLEREASLSNAAAAAAPTEPPPPRDPDVITLDLLTEIVAHLGNKGRLEDLLEELKAASK